MDPQKLLRHTGVPETRGFTAPVLGSLYKKLYPPQSSREPQSGSLPLFYHKKTVEFCQNVFAKLDIFSEIEYNMDSYKVCLWAL